MYLESELGACNGNASHVGILEGHHSERLRCLRHGGLVEELRMRGHRELHTRGIESSRCLIVGHEVADGHTLGDQRGHWRLWGWLRAVAI